jgi:hypothetical protein
MTTFPPDAASPDDPEAVPDPDAPPEEAEDPQPASRLMHITAAHPNAINFFIFASLKTRVKEYILHFIVRFH